jgi:hypothetical protein
MEPASDFQWPDDPPQDWWEATGAALGMKPELVRFAAALLQLGGPEARKNSVAARLAGVAGGRTQAFRAARSVGVRRLLDEAEKVTLGKRPPITEAEIDRKVEDLIRSPDAGTVAKGIELRHRREDRERADRRSRDGEPADIAEITRQLLEISGREGAISACELWHTIATNLMDCPYFRLLAPIISHNHPGLWQRYRSPMAGRVEFFKGSEHEQRILAEFDAAGAAPEPTDEQFRAAIGKLAVHRGNGAAAPELLLEQTGDIENAAA